MVRIGLDKVIVDLAVYNSRGCALKSEILRRAVGVSLENVATVASKWCRLRMRSVSRPGTAIESASQGKWRRTDDTPARS